MQTWRLIPLINASGAVQMAIDQWLFEQHRLGTHPPTLRFYTWSPVAISLGYHQRQFPEFWKQLTWQGGAIDLIRRPSGGRAVLHQGDLTYAVITSGLSGRRLQDYQTICQFLIDGWRSLGVELHYGNAGRSYIHNSNCFGTATIADLVLEDGTKLIGSAQLRKDQAILQHGSMQLAPNPQLYHQIFAASQPCQQSPILKDVLSSTGTDIEIDAVIDTVMKALTQAACSRFAINVNTRSLTSSEWQAITALL